MKVLKYPHPVLQYRCKPVLRIDAELRSIVAAMFDTMYAAEGVGLAANQVGLPLQLFVMNPTADKTHSEEEYVFINPVITKKTGNETDNEGCLSFPEIHADVVRASAIEVESISLTGVEQRFRWKDRQARIVQHEIDHLKGISFADRLSPAAELSIREDLEELRQVFESERNVGEVADDKTLLKELETWEQKFCFCP